jgi:eukaryotic-like serine/threonine-protein kinase
VRLALNTSDRPVTREPSLADVEPGPLDVGQVLDGKYELLRWLASGAMGEVWVARHRALEEPVAIKVLFPSYDAYDCGESSTRFLLEARIAARLSTRTAHVVRVTDYGQYGSRPYLVMDLLDGETLESELHRGPLQPGRVAAIVTQVARALALAHADGILHRDIKPANVFLTTDEDGGLLVKLLDFGIACAREGRIARNPRVTADGVAIGTPAYMSPEQVAAASEVDLQCDLWALAATAFEALTGQTPVHGHDVREMFMNLLAGRVSAIGHKHAGVPEALCPFFDRAFARRKADRYESAAAMATAFHRAASERDTPLARTMRVAGARCVPATVRMAPSGRVHGAPRVHRALTLWASIAVVAAVGAVSSSWSASATSAAQSTPCQSLAPHPQRRAVEALLPTYPGAPTAPTPSASSVPSTRSPTPRSQPGRIIDRSALF